MMVALRVLVLFTALSFFQANTASAADGEVIERVNSVAGLLARVGHKDGEKLFVDSFYPPDAKFSGGREYLGGGLFVWDARMPRVRHNGITIISPSVLWNGKQSTLHSFLNGDQERNPRANGSWRRISEELDPMMAGARGDGVTDDFEAFNAWARVVNEKERAFVKIPSGNYLVNDSITFDLEYLDLYLASGARVFSERRSSKGQLLGVIGFSGSGTASIPQREYVKIHGPGRVDAWAKGNNENGIGISRYKIAIIDGVTATGGNKGITAQYGMGQVLISNVQVPEAGFRGITVEDQGASTDVRIENAVIGKTGDAGILAAGARVVLRKISIDEAHKLSGSTSLGAIHVNSTKDLQYADVEEIDIGNTHSGKGVVISRASKANVFNVLVKGSGGQAIDVSTSKVVEFRSQIP
ncbi:hypothetical protein LJR296_003990 [Cupriavidus necator]|uniref:hypothetical protein n=1 Tax=Cupriavidus necator TaxID=106590 RepID=UPI003ED12FA6